LRLVWHSLVGELDSRSLVFIDEMCTYATIRGETPSLRLTS
jgi:hypothetical protein